jgi:hypothetical protein
LALLGAVYVIAFASLGVQIAGLVGDTGILPARDYLDLVARRLGPEAWRRLPTLCWVVGAGTHALQGLCAAGAACGLALALGIMPGPAALAAWGLYLSLVAAGQAFLGFQWDALLLETGLLALLVAPWRRRVGRGSPSLAALLPLWCLVFKLHLLSGWVKLASGDPTWRDLTALEYHYWTTCLPVWIGWYAAQLPPIVQRASVVVMFVIELLVPFAILGPRRLRHAAAGAMIALQLGIAATGNYGFFNLLTVALCLSLLDDAALGRWLPGPRNEAPPSPRRPAFRIVTLGAALLLAVLTFLPMAVRMAGADALPAPARRALDLLAPLRSFNAYGLFADMTTLRPEIVIEGSDDGDTWRPYEFRWKPGDPARRPEFVQPYMPRLDWQMWFAALQGSEHTYWFGPFLGRLLAGEPSVTGLLATQPFADHPPRYVRAVSYRYEFATPAERGRGLWWSREMVGLYAPPTQAAPGDGSAPQ